MNTASARTDETARAPEGYRSALAELVQIGLSVARMVGRAAEAETAAAEAAARVNVEDGVRETVASSLAEAIEQDRAYAAAAEARHTVVTRADVVSRAFAKVARSVRLTVAMAERIDGAWARRSAADDRQAMARRHVVRGVAEVIERTLAGSEAGMLEQGVRETERERLTVALEERLERLDEEAALGRVPAEEIITGICRDLGLDAARMLVTPPFAKAGRFSKADGIAPPEGAHWTWYPGPPWRQPDG